MDYKFLEFVDVTIFNEQGEAVLERSSTEHIQANLLSGGYTIQFIPIEPGCCWLSCSEDGEECPEGYQKIFATPTPQAFTARIEIDEYHPENLRGEFGCVCDLMVIKRCEFECVPEPTLTANP